MVKSSWCFVQLMWTRCEHLTQKQSVLSACNISSSVHFEMLIICSFQACFHVIFNHPITKSALNILSYAKWLVSNYCCTFLVSNSPTLLCLRNRCFTFTLFNFL